MVGDFGLGGLPIEILKSSLDQAFNINILHQPKIRRKRKQLGITGSVLCVQFTRGRNKSWYLDKKRSRIESNPMITIWVTGQLEMITWPLHLLHNSSWQQSNLEPDWRVFGQFAKIETTTIISFLIVLRYSTYSTYNLYKKYDVDFGCLGYTICWNRKYLW